PARRPTPPRRTEPREEYLNVSLQPSQPLADPTTARKLIVLDLNGSLLLRSAHQRRVPQPQANQRWQGRGGGSPRATGDPYADPTQLRPLRTVHRRPYLTSFAAYILHEETKKWLDTMVWSSAQPHSVADMVEQCFGERKAELKGVWARDTLGLTADDYNKKSITLKDLEKPWAELSRNPTPTTASVEHSALTTMLIDDSPAKAALQPWNHLCIEEYLQAKRNLDLIVADWEATQPKGASSHGPPSTEAGEIDEHAEAAPGMRRIIREAEERGEPPASVEEARTSPPPPLRYDETLLAVVGVLDRIKHEGNVAGWMRSGGLLTTALGTGTHGPETDDAGASALPTPPPSSQLTEFTAADEAEQTATGVPLSSPIPPPASVPQSLSQVPSAEPQGAKAGLWYENPAVLLYWADRGRAALKALGIPVESGMTAVPGGLQNGKGKGKSKA
ncbi:hypothetical protein HYPSUDRAFT_149081, partial [Hypholoma sublateritium FD-334 SS-4]